MTERLTEFTVDLDTWSRRDEVVCYALLNKITYAEAVERLVNSGLSHYRGPALHLGHPKDGR